MEDFKYYSILIMVFVLSIIGCYCFVPFIGAREKNYEGARYRLLEGCWILDSFLVSLFAIYLRSHSSLIRTCTSDIMVVKSSNRFGLTVERINATPVHWSGGCAAIAAM